MGKKANRWVPLSACFEGNAKGTPPILGVNVEYNYMLLSADSEQGLRVRVLGSNVPHIFLEFFWAQFGVFARVI